MPVLIAETYRYLAKHPTWKDAGSERLLVWGRRFNTDGTALPRFSTVTVRPAELFLELLELEATEEAIRQFADRYGPYFGLENSLGDDEGIGEAWRTFISADGRNQEAALAVTDEVVRFLMRYDDRVSLEDILGERALLRRRAERVGALESIEPPHLDPPSAFPSVDLGEFRTPGTSPNGPVPDIRVGTRPERPAPERRGDRLLRWAIEDAGLRADLTVELRTNAEGGIAGPVLVARPYRPYGIFAVAELGIIELLIDRTPVRVCEQCGKLFLPADHRRRRYCSPRCKSISNAQGHERARQAAKRSAE